MVKCEYCDTEHWGKVCPLIKAIEYYSNGAIKGVEFKVPTDYYHPWPYSGITVKPPQPNPPGGWGYNGPVDGISVSFGEDKP